MKYLFPLKKAFFSLLLIGLYAIPAYSMPVVYSWDSEKIIKVIDFPDIAAYQTQEGKYVDAGYLYKQVSLFFVPLWNYDGRWVGYIGDDGKYIQLNRQELSELAEEVNLKLPNKPTLPFWDSIGGKIIAIIFIIILLIGFMQERTEKSEEQNKTT